MKAVADAYDALRYAVVMRGEDSVDRYLHANHRTVIGDPRGAVAWTSTVRNGGAGRGWKVASRAKQRRRLLAR